MKKPPEGGFFVCGTQAAVAAAWWTGKALSTLRVSDAVLWRSASFRPPFGVA